MAEPNEKKEKFTKPGYDARLQYYEVLKKYLEALSVATVDRDFPLWYRVVRGMYSLLWGYMQPEKARTILNRLDSFRSRLFDYNNCTSAEYKNSPLIIEEMQDEIQRITDELMASTKHIWLPIKDETEEEFDAEEFFKGSDL